MFPGRVRKIALASYASNMLRPPLPSRALPTLSRQFTDVVPSLTGRFARPCCSLRMLRAVHEPVRGWVLQIREVKINRGNENLNPVRLHVYHVHIILCTEKKFG